MARLRCTHEAEQWLRDIFDYIAQDKPDATERVVNGIYEKSQLLMEFPEIGYRYRMEEEGEIRVMLYGHYRIAYLRRNDSDWIDVLGVFHGALGIDRYFP